ncbi:transmembrane protein [Ceratobasidium sp. AG-Ba]|nr:transmembrane protein [Ceratobasidium sp. AG-Ba]
MRVIAATGILSNSIMMCILLLRVWAIWGRKLWMLLILLSVFASSQLPPAILIGGELSKLQLIDNPLPGILTGCVVTSQSSLHANWVHLFISSLTYESTLFALTLIQAWIINRRGAGTPIMTLLTRDGAWYFLPVSGSVSLTAIGTSVQKTQVAALLSQ